MRFSRVDHIVLQVPRIEEAHAQLLALGFGEAWPIGRTWPYGPTSGIALGGINLELLQPDEDPPSTARLAEIVFAPAEGISLESYGRVVPKIEDDPVKLASRGFPPELRDSPQRICTNAFPGADSPWPHFVCDYHPILLGRLSGDRFAAPFGPVRRIDIGPLATRSRFVERSENPDLARFVSETHLLFGPTLGTGRDGVMFSRGDKRLDLTNLTIEA